MGRKVGLDVVPLLRAAISQAEPGDHFVENEQNVVFVADGADTLQEFGHRRDDALHRLGEDRGDIGVVLGDDLAQRGEVVIGADQHGRDGCIGLPAGIGRALRVVAGFLRKGGDDRVVVVAVIGALELEDLVAPGEGPREAHRVGGRFRTGGRVGDFLGAGYVVDETFGEADSDLV